MLGSETLAGLTEQLVEGCRSRARSRLSSIAGATWEHIDFNMFLK